MMTFEAGRMRTYCTGLSGERNLAIAMVKIVTCRFPRFSALQMFLRASAKTFIRTMVTFLYPVSEIKDLDRF